MSNYRKKIVCFGYKNYNFFYDNGRLCSYLEVIIKVTGADDFFCNFKVKMSINKSEKALL